MDWDDLDDILYDGTEEEIKKARCPVCGGSIRYRYGDKCGTFQTWCDHCGIYSKGIKGPKPNCAELFGDEYTIK